MNPSESITKQTERFDIYANVHKGLRAFMADTLTAIGRIDAADAGEVADGIDRTRALIDICRDHLHHENQFIHPAMEAGWQGSARTTAGDHVQHEEAFERLEAETLAVETSLSLDERTVALRTLYRSLAVFTAENFLHMDVEETENNAVLWSAYTDAQIAGIQNAIVSAVAPERMLVMLRWMIPSMSTAERIAMLKGIRATVSDAGFEYILQLVEGSLPGRDWVKLVRALGVAREREALVVA